MNGMDLADPASQFGDSVSHKSELVLDALLNLRPEMREVLIMRDMEEQPFSAIANALGIQVGAAKMRVQRARLAMIAVLHSQEQTEDDA